MVVLLEVVVRHEQFFLMKTYPGLLFWSWVTSCGVTSNMLRMRGSSGEKYDAASGGGGLKARKEVQRREVSVQLRGELGWEVRDREKGKWNERRKKMTMGKLKEEEILFSTSTSFIGFGEFRQTG